MEPRLRQPRTARETKARFLFFLAVLLSRFRVHALCTVLAVCAVGLSTPLGGDVKSAGGGLGRFRDTHERAVVAHIRVLPIYIDTYFFVLKECIGLEAAGDGWQTLEVFHVS